MKWPMLTRRGVTYYHRQVVPLALRPLLDNRREIWKSLRTTDLNKPGNLRRALRSATAQIRSLGRRGYRTHSIALVFRVPQLSVDSATTDEVDTLWTKFVDSLREPKTLGADFVAIHRGESRAVQRAAMAHSRTWNPGVAAIGKIVYRGKR